MHVNPNQVRAILMNASQLASYDWFKRVLLRMDGAKDGPALQFGASFLAGTVATSEWERDSELGWEEESVDEEMWGFSSFTLSLAVCAPADVIKSRIMAAKAHHVVSH